MVNIAYMQATLKREQRKKKPSENAVKYFPNNITTFFSVRVRRGDLATPQRQKKNQTDGSDAME